MLARTMEHNPFAALPRTDVLLEQAQDLTNRYGRDDTRAALTVGLDRARKLLGRGDLPADMDALTEWLIDQAGDDLVARRPAGPRRVINAAGVVVHTNLGRAPLSIDAVQAMVAASGYCDLEFDLESGRRGSRGSHVDTLLADATGAPAAMTVNNCAAALVLTLSVLAAGRQVPVSRGHLVEIGGSFRLPDIMASSGAILLEVGTTNRTRAADYDSGHDVGALLTVHPSNFAQSGFVTQPALAQVAAVAGRREVPLIHDAGSGLLTPGEGALANELSMAEALGAGADLVLASGDKLLGGPQAGLIIGRTDLIDRLRTAPLTRALRLDKLRLAALNATLLAHLRYRQSTVAATLEDDTCLPDRAAGMAQALGAEVQSASTVIGGGSAPGVGVTSPVVVLPDDHQLAGRLRHNDPPVIARVQDDKIMVDLRTVEPDDDKTIVAAVRKARRGLKAS